MTLFNVIVTAVFIVLAYFLYLFFSRSILLLNHSLMYALGDALANELQVTPIRDNKFEYYDHEVTIGDLKFEASIYEEDNKISIFFNEESLSMSDAHKLVKHTFRAYSDSWLSRCLFAVVIGPERITSLIFGILNDTNDHDVCRAVLRATEISIRGRHSV